MTIEKHGPENRKMVEEALIKFNNDIEVLGSTPYVEADDQKQEQNIDWAIQLAMKYNLHLDFHLDYNLNEDDRPKGCIGINNVGNAFTPWGSCDPLRLASLCVGVYQAGTPKDAELLFECIAALAQEAIGLKDVVVRSLEEGQKALFMVVENDAKIQLDHISVPARRRLGVADMVWDPPELHKRRVVGQV
ncbi:hypothetical protein LTS08_000074 [Lithohypha guttulata]|uniref:Uncharacterized protein n=1 Tax=Lithohypha guttulata TaxID=1690604 RepID=A0AAN7YG29_9EURO|nr:hypothetical protein LTR05_005570 [Lithohypha guttulata]KAK5105959.1 hypothetical protein LTS08_000074 [Lithohypha guttulata]